MMLRTLVALVSVVLAALALPAAAVARRACSSKAEQVVAGTWTSRPVDGIRGGRWTWRMAADEGDPRLVVVADSKGVLVTHDGGCTWDRAARYTDFLAPFEGMPIDAVVAGSGRDRSLHVLVAPWTAFVPSGPTKLLSSFDDGATWTSVDAPAAAGPASFSLLSLTASPATPEVVYLLASHPGVTGGVWAGSGRDGWRWQSATLFAMSPGTCLPETTCLSRSLAELAADPRGDALWALTRPTIDAGEAVGHSADGGATWRHREVPPLIGGVSLLLVSPARRDATVAVLGDFWEYAISKNGGRSWAAGELPKITSSDRTATSVFEAAHYDRGRRLAAIVGDGPMSGWAGNLLTFDGRRWTEATPPGFAGYAATDADGNDLSLVALASTKGPLLALSSRGELMSLTPEP